VEKTAEFTAGQLIVTATLNGEPFATPVEITDAQGKTVFGNSTNYPKSGTRNVWLPTGVYGVTVTNSSDTSQMRRFDAMEIAPGASETLTVTFPIVP